LRGTTNQQTIFEQQISLDADSAAPFELNVPGGIGRLTLNANAPGDGLSVDDTVTLVEPKIRLLSIAVTLPDDSAEQRLVQRALAAMPDVQLGTPDRAHLLIGPAGELPQPRGDLWWLGIGPLNPSPLVRKQARDLLGPYLIEKQHPLLDGVVLG